VHFKCSASVKSGMWRPIGPSDLPVPTLIGVDAAVISLRVFSGLSRQLGRILPAPPPNRPLNRVIIRVKQLTFLVQTHAETRPKRLSAPAAAG